MSYTLRRVPNGFRAIAACDYGDCIVRIDRVKRTEAEAATALVYALPAAGWNGDDFPRGIYCPTHKGASPAVKDEDRLATVRRGYVQMRRLHAEIGMTVAAEDSMGTPTRAFMGLGGIMRGSAGEMRGMRQEDALAIADAMGDLAMLATGMTWAGVRS